MYDADPVIENGSLHCVEPKTLCEALNEDKGTGGIATRQS